MANQKVRSQIADYISRHPELPYRVIAAKLGCCIATVSGIAIEFGHRRYKHLNNDDLSTLLAADREASDAQSL